MVNLNSVPVRILFVEDNDGDAYLFRDALNKAGLVPEFTRVSDGDSARTICSTAE